MHNPYPVLKIIFSSQMNFDFRIRFLKGSLPLLFLGLSLDFSFGPCMNIEINGTFVDP